MATVTHTPAEVQTAEDVVRCYDILDAGVIGGFGDLTDGRNVKEPTNWAEYCRSQDEQAEYLLDQIACDRGTRILDVGCGYGRILDHAARRGAETVGITISPPQHAHCRQRGLDVHLLNYRAIDNDWDGQFDGIVANGSLEHFAQIEDALADRSDEIYEEMFAICRRLMAPGKRFVTTAIHFREPNQVRAEDVAKGLSQLPSGSQEYHVAMLERNFGGWYPEPGQLERCAARHFRLAEEEDGTLDYHRTSEYWLRQIKWSLGLSPRFLYRLVRNSLKNGRATWDMLRCLVWDQSWMWQFRGNPAPTVLWRHTWEAI